MQPFDYQRATEPQGAVTALTSAPRGKFLAGGTNLVDLMKQQVETPAHLVDINRLDLAKMEELPDGGLRLGALARNADTAEHPLVRERYPMLAQAIPGGCIAAIAQSGDQRRQPAAAYALLLLLRSRVREVQ